MARKSIIDASGHADEILQWLQSGWQAEKVVVECRRRFGLKVSRRTVYRYLERLGPDAGVPAAYLKRKLRDVDVILAEIQDLQDLAAVQKLRLGEAMYLEEQMGGILIKPVEKAIREYRNTLCKLLYKKQKIGLAPVAAGCMAQNADTTTSGPDLTMDEVFSVLSAEAASEMTTILLRAVREIPGFGRAGTTAHAAGV